jgi:hypothetical protein
MIIRRQWKGIDDNDCVLCHQHVLEDLKHMFFTCQFSSRTGIIYILSGEIIQWHKVFPLQRKVSKVPVLLMWLFWLVRIYGNKEIIGFLSI